MPTEKRQCILILIEASTFEEYGQKYRELRKKGWRGMILRNYTDLTDAAGKLEEFTYPAHYFQNGTPQSL